MIDEYILGTRDDAIHCEYLYAYVLLVRKVGMQSLLKEFTLYWGEIRWMWYYIGVEMKVTK